MKKIHIGQKINLGKFIILYIDLLKLFYFKTTI
jgi:hypothetical protein